MRRFLLSLLICNFLNPALADNNHKDLKLPDVDESTGVSFFWAQDANPHAKSHAASTATTTTSPLMTVHGGSAMPNVNTSVIFWGKSWNPTPANKSFIGDKVSMLNYFYSNIGSSTYMSTLTEYSPSVSITNQSSMTDYTTAAKSSTSSVLAEVCKMTNGAPKSNYYPVYTDLKRGSAGYCAYHSAGTCNGVLVQFSFFFNLDGDSGCDPKSTYTSYSQGTAALANVSAHEFTETVTDPAAKNTSGLLYWSGWYDATGNEDGDKCAWTFGPASLNGSVPKGTVYVGTVPFKLQGEWSNAAYNAVPSKGYANGGCIAGTGF